MQVLAPKDADLYRAAFDAQARGDEATANTALSNLVDHKLVGHVLADRYKRRAPTSAELHDWLAAYSDLPQANDFYKKARAMPTSQGKTIKQPNSHDSWNGGGAVEASLGFRTDMNDQNSTSSESRRLKAKIDRLLKRGEPQQAEALLQQDMNKRAMSDAEHAALASRIAAALFYDDKVDDARVMADKAVFGRDPAEHNPLALWIGGLASWKQGDATAAGKFFTRLAASNKLSSWDRAATSFWAYRALKATGDTKLARYWLAQAAKQPQSFYGQLAAHLLGHDETVKSWQLPQLDHANIALLSSRPAGWRALALIQVGQTALAESELQRLNPQGRRDLQEAMLAVAEATQMPSLSMRLGRIATNTQGKRYDAAMYPVPPWQPEHGFEVNRALMYALMRHESGFNPVAMSGSGACGLMQLMPATANLVANDNARTTTVIDDCSGRLLNPAYNMSLGQKYVRHLADQPQIGDNLMLLLAAYNGGPGNVARWMDDDSTRHDPLLFVESMPMRETRDYVQQVMIHYWNYCARLSQPQTSLAQLARGEWPRLMVRAPTQSVEKKFSKQVQLDTGSYKVATAR